MLAKYPRFGDAMANCQIEIKTDLKYHTAATDGKNVFVDPKYFESLTEEEKQKWNEYIDSLDTDTTLPF